MQKKEFISSGNLIGISNIGCVAALQERGFEIVGEKRNGHVYFYFEKNTIVNGAHLDDVLNDYINDRLMVRANSYYSKLDFIKSHVFTKFTKE